MRPKLRCCNHPIYDDAAFTGLTRRGQEDWLLRQPAPVLRLNVNLPISRLLHRLLSPFA